MSRDNAFLAPDPAPLTAPHFACLGLESSLRRPAWFKASHKVAQLAALHSSPVLGEAALTFPNAYPANRQKMPPSLLTGPHCLHALSTIEGTTWGASPGALPQG